jgi:hypothetical protein
MRRIVIFVWLVIFVGCGAESLPEPPNFSSHLAKSVEDAKKMAGLISSQKCTYAGYKSTGEDDAGVYLLECERGLYELYTTQAHTFSEFFTWKVGDEARFRSSDTLLLKPHFEEVRRKRETNATFYLEPLGTVAIPPPPRPRPIK